MQRQARSGNRAIARWVATLVLAAFAAYFGRDHMPNATTGDPPPERIAGAGRPVDGDSLYVGSQEVRLQGIDAPEGRQTCQRDGRAWACGEAARSHLRSMIANNTVECRVTGRDRHGRLLAYCSAAGRDLNGGMVASGMAVAYGGFVREEGLAKAAKKGLWGSQFERPRAWRDERRAS